MILSLGILVAVVYPTFWTVQCLFCLFVRPQTILEKLLSGSAVFLRFTAVEIAAFTTAADTLWFPVVLTELITFQLSFYRPRCAVILALLVNLCAGALEVTLAYDDLSGEYRTPVIALFCVAEAIVLFVFYRILFQRTEAVELFFAEDG